MKHITNNMAKQLSSIMVALAALIIFLLHFSAPMAQAILELHPYIIVHAINPEGIEILSIRGIDDSLAPSITRRPKVYDGENVSSQ